MLKPDSADLCFNPTHQPVGFTSGVLAQFDGSAEPVVRELLQNSLDAADRAGRPAEVQFVICEVPKTALPGWGTYNCVLAKALEDRKKWNLGKPSHDEKMVIERIRGCLSRPMVPLLLCIDNGHGLNGRRMDALLTPGNTSKGEHGAGSFGLGHHAAFGASNLRYVLYAARYSKPQGAGRSQAHTGRSEADTGPSRALRGRSEAHTASIASGHAILASHRGEDPDKDASSRNPPRQGMPGSANQKDKDAGTRLYAADGYWFRVGQRELAFDGTHANYPRVPPDLLAPYLHDLHDTGTVVCIVGFNDFHRDDHDPSAVESICRVAAANFSDAICSESLAVVVRDERHDDEVEVSKARLYQVLEPVSQQLRAEKSGQISGSNAYAALRTRLEGERIESPEGSTIRWRVLGESDRLLTQVHVFRKGMWITSRAPGLKKGDFSRCEPFDAVLSLESGPLEQLVRSAEGPEHRGIDRPRLNPREKSRLKELIADVADRLREAVRERDDLEEFTPPGFATLEGQLNRAAEKVRRARAPSGGGKRAAPVDGGKKKTDRGEKKARRQGTPRPGSVPSYRSALRVGAASRVVEALVEYDEETTANSRMGVRVRAASGADGSCEQPLPDTFLRMASIADDSGHSTDAEASGGDLELVLPAVTGRRRLTAVLAEPVDDPGLLELDIVRRKPQAARDAAAGEDSA